MTEIFVMAERQTGMTREELLSQAPSNRVQMRSGDYLDADGAVICGECGMAREVMEVADDGTQVWFPVEHYHDIEREHVEQDIELSRIACFENYEKYRDATFDDCDAPMKEELMAFVGNFEELSRKGRGVILYGEPGRGKTYAAACVLNDLIRAGKRCKMTSITSIMDPVEFKAAKIRKLRDYDCVCIDDFGSERTNAYGKETGFEVINRLYAMGKPVIVTTNLNAEQLRRPPMEYVKTIERLKERCDRLEYSGPNRRQGVLS